MLTETALFLAALGATNQLADPGLTEVVNCCRHTPRAFTQVPFWFWNGPLDPNEMRRQLREMADHGVYAAMPHPRFGMDRRQYLEPAYWRTMSATLAEARKLGMKIWLYDEYNWPSGGAGGRVTEGHPELYPRGLDYQKLIVTGPTNLTLPLPPPTEPRMEVSEKLVLGCLKILDSPQPRFEAWGTVTTNPWQIQGTIPPGRCELLVFFQALGRNPSSLDDGSNAMTDYLSELSVRRFLQLTHEAYRARFGKYWGREIPAVFVDECSTTSPAAFPWCDDFLVQFADRRGFQLGPRIPDLLDADSGPAALTRLAYWQTVTELFSQRWLGTYSRWCQTHNLKLTGHVFEENLASYAHAPQLMDLLRPMDIPGIDALGPTCPPHNAKVMVSLAELENKAEALCECFGLAGGWNCTLSMLRAGYHQLGMLGVSRFVPHAFFQTLDNPRIESPPSFFLGNPYWKYYREIADLSARWSYLNHIGQRVATCAVYYPIESLWADSTGGKGQNVLPWQHRIVGNDHAQQTIQAFNDLVDQLYVRRHDLQVVDNRALARCEIDTAPGTRLRISNSAFQILVVPPITAIGSEALEAIDRFLNRGGTVLWMHRFPNCSWPHTEQSPQAVFARWFNRGLPNEYGRYPVGKGTLYYLPAMASAVVDQIEQVAVPDVVFPSPIPSLRIAHRKTPRLDLFLCYNDSDDFVDTEIGLPQRPPAIVVDLDSGRTFRAAPTSFGLQLALRPRQAVCFIPTSTVSSLPLWSVSRPTGRPINLDDDWRIQVAGESLDHEWGTRLGDTQVALPVFRMKPRGFQRYEGWEKTTYPDREWPLVPAVRGQALSSEPTTLLFRTLLPPGVRSLALPLPVMGEYTVWINGKLLTKNLGPAPRKAAWLDLTGFVLGTNDVFALETGAHHDVAGLKQPIIARCGPAQIAQLQSWQTLGLGHYSGRVVYSREFVLDRLPRRVWLDLGKVEHYVEVYVNGSQAGTMLWPPYELEITNLARAGGNTLTLVVANSIANRFAWDVWGTRGQGAPEPSGILGPARLWVE
jgi:hypothetical protein